MARTRSGRYDEFDPYHKWLGIPKGKRPPTHFQLLGISSDEYDETVIETAAARQSTFVSRFRGGEHDEFAGQLLYQIEEARFTLLDPSARRDYEARLNLRKRGRKAVPPRSRRTVGEESGLFREYLGVMSVILGGFIIMAVVAFALPWRKPDKPEAGNVAVAEANPAAVIPAAVEATEEEPPRPVLAPKPAEVPPSEPEALEAPQVANDDEEPMPEATTPAPVIQAAKVGTIRGHTKNVRCLAFSQDGTRLVSGSEDGSVKVWDSEFHSLVTSFDHGHSVRSVDVSPDGELVVSAGERILRIFDATSGRQTAIFNQGSTVTTVFFLSDGQTLLSGGSSRSGIHKWELGQRNAMASYDNDCPVVIGIALAPDGRTFASTARGKVIIRNTHDGDVVSELPFGDDIVQADSLAYSPDGQTLAGTPIGGRERKERWGVLIWNVAERRIVKSLIGDWNMLLHVVMHPSGKILAASSYKRTGEQNVHQVTLFEIDSGKVLRTLDVQRDKMFGLAFSPDGGVLAIGALDGSIHLIPVETP